MIALLRRQPLAWGVVIGGALLLLAQLLAAWRLEASRGQIEQQIKRNSARWSQLAAAPLAPTPENLARLEAHRRELEAEVERLRTVLTEATEPLVPRAFRGSEALYFEIAGYIDRTRQAMQAAGIGLGADEQLGFQQFVEARQVVLPAPEGSTEGQRAMGRIDVQLQVLDALARALIAARPMGVEAVEREAVPAASVENRSLPADIFVVDPLQTAAVPGAIETTGFRLRFSGRTAALRSFLRAVADLPLPVSVRSVEVEPSAPVTRPAGRRPDIRAGNPTVPVTAAGDSPFAVFGVDPRAPTNSSGGAPELAQPVPIVTDNASAFTVVIEYYTIADADEEGGYQ